MDASSTTMAIVERDSHWYIVNGAGKELGCYNTMAEAKDGLRTIHRVKATITLKESPLMKEIKVDENKAVASLEEKRSILAQNTIGKLEG
jgi:hypothetical protein